MKYKLFIIALCMLLVSFVTVSSSAQEAEMDGELTIASPSPAMTITPTPDYLLPYPGILPDSPLYGFKTLRDKIVSTMIGDPLKKAEFDLLQADKRIGAALLLLKTGNKEKQLVALSTISKGQNYYEEAIEKLAEARKQGTGVTSIDTNMKRAGAAHIYLMQQAKKSLHKQLQPEIDQLIARSISLRNRVKEAK